MKPIKQYRGKYLACPTGRIWAEPSNKRPKGCYLKPWLIGNGYEMVMLFNPKKKYLVHRLIADAFVPNPKNLPEINHIDGNRLNNKPENLEWVTSKTNKQHAWDNGLYRHRGEQHPLTTLTVKDIKEIRKLCTEGKYTQRKIAQIFGVDPMTISNIKLGKTWGHIK